MKSGIVFVAGAAAGVYGVLKARRVAEAFTPEGVHDRANALRLGAQLFRQEVARGQADAEIELRERLRSLHAGQQARHDGPGARPQLSSTQSSTHSSTQSSTEEGTR